MTTLRKVLNNIEQLSLTLLMLMYAEAYFLGPLINWWTLLFFFVFFFFKKKHSKQCAFCDDIATLVIFSFVFWGRAAWLKMLLCSEWFRGSEVLVPLLLLRDKYDYHKSCFGGKLSVIWLQGRWQDVIEAPYTQYTLCISSWRRACGEVYAVYPSLKSYLLLFFFISLVGICCSLLPMLFFSYFTSVIYCFYTSCILLTSLSGSCRGAVSRFMMNTVGIMKKPSGCCWSLIRAGVFGHVYWWERGSTCPHNVDALWYFKLLTCCNLAEIRRSVIKSE